MKRHSSLILAVVVGLFAVACMQQIPVDTTAYRMMKEELMTIMNRPDVIIVDVRTDRDWKAADRKIKGAVREDPEQDIKSWASKYPRDKTLVFY
jgi:hypothetical protein